MPQAFGLAPLLRDKAFQWARESAALSSYGQDSHQAETGTSSTAESKAARRFSPMWWVESGTVKAPRRAAEKAVSCYGGDASRLLDMCRARIVVADVMALARCLERIAEDFTVRVVRVKDGIGCESDAAVSGGFRVRLKPGNSKLNLMVRYCSLSCAIFSTVLS